MTKKTWTPPFTDPCSSRYFQISNKINSYLQKVFNVFMIKKRKLHHGRTILYFIALLNSLFLLFWWIAAENRTKLKKLFIWTTKSSGAQHHKYKNCTWLFISNCITLVIFWTERNFCTIFDCRNSFNKTFFIPANTQSSSEKFLKGKLHTCIGMCSLFTCFNIQILNYVTDDIGIFTMLSDI